MTAMTDLTENTELSGPVDPEESVTAAEKDELLSLLEAFENNLDISQDVEPKESAASEETDGREKPEQEDGQQDGEKDRQQDGERDRQEDGQEDGQQGGQPVSPPAAESSSTELKWVVGAQCRAQWLEDGRVYPATVVSLDGERCRVRFNGYNNKQDMDVSALKSPETPLQRQNSQQEWKPGALCRAVYSEDRLFYPAVVLWVKGQRCRVRFENYDNEEELDVDSLLSPDELHGVSRYKGSSWKSSVSSSSLDWKRRGGDRRREESQGERGAERRSAGREEEHNSSGVKEKQSNQSKVEKDSAEKPTNHSFSFFPPFPPPPSSLGDPAVFVPPPPPPPLWPFSGRESAVDPASSMLMLWYMCGFHTGSYMAQQGFKSRSKD